jgi:hypothetical protein
MKIGQVLCNWLKVLNHFFKRSYNVYPTFGSTFIQYWYCQNWDVNRWLEEYRMLKKIGIQEIILQCIADTKSFYAVYPTRLKGYSSNSIDMVEIALRAAEIMGMKVRIGLGSNDDWWSLNAFDEEWLNQEAEVNSFIATEILNHYDNHRAFAGWYIPHEFHPLLALSYEEQINLNGFFKKITGTIKLKSNKSIMVAPFYNARLYGTVPMTLWSSIVQTTFKNTGVDILALQDSIGAGFNTIEVLDELYAYTKSALDEIGLRLYTVTETFEKATMGNRPAPLAKIRKQMAKVSPYVSGYVAFSIDHYQNGNEQPQIKEFEDYLRYYSNFS